MKILIIANHLLDSKISSGGDRVFVEIAKRWKRWGAKVVVNAPQLAIDDVSSIIKPDEKISTSPSLGDSLAQRSVGIIPLFYALRTLKALRLLRSVEADVIYTPGDFFCNVIPAYFVKKKTGAWWVANIYHINDSPLVRKGNSFLASTVSFLLQRFSFFLLKRYTDVIFLSNQQIGEALVKIGFPPERLHAVGMGGVELEKFKVQSANGGSRFKVYEACFLGRLNPTKGIFDLPKIWKKVTEKIPQARLIVVGGGKKWRAPLQDQINTAGLGKNMTIAGFVSEEEKYKLLSQSKVFVFPSYEEGWGMAIAEALAAGLPAVAYNLPPYQEVFPQSIITVKTGDTNALADEVLKLLEDEKNYQIWSKRGHDLVQKYDWASIAKIQWEIIRDEN